MLAPKIAATGISVSCGSWWRESNVANAAAGKSTMMALVVNSWCTSARRTGWISRALVRDLGGRLKARVELRQIGPRDETRLQGGIGPCGRGVCCATFLKDFEPVSVRMPKTQPT
jgi:hypothetical protein